MTNTPQQNKYRKYLFQYGILPVLMVLEYFESFENYEECQEIIDTIKSVNESIGIKLSTVLTEEVIEDVISEYIKLNIDEENLYDNSCCYAATILNDLNIIQHD